MASERSKRRDLLVLSFITILLSFDHVIVLAFVVVKELNFKSKETYTVWT